MAIVPGDKYVALTTARNTMNKISSADDIRIAHVDQESVSIWVIGRGGSQRKLAVPKVLFGTNFETDRAHLAPPNRGYISATRFTGRYD